MYTCMYTYHDEISQFNFTGFLGHLFGSYADPGAQVKIMVPSSQWDSFHPIWERFILATAKFKWVQTTYGGFHKWGYPKNGCL